MPLTPAERQKRYREKLKTENTDKFAEVKKKNSERALKYYKDKTSNYSEEQKEEQRRKWREDRRKAKEKSQLSTTQNIEKQTVINEENARNIQRREEYRLRQENTELRKKLKRMLKGFQTLKKRLNRQKKKFEEMSKKYDNAMIKLKALEHKNVTQEYTPKKKTEDFLNETIPSVPTSKKEKVKKIILEHNILTEAMKLEFQKSSNVEKAVFKRVANSELVNKYKYKKQITSSLGLKYNLKRYRDRKIKRNELQNKITSFYLRDDVSRATAGKKEYKTNKKVKYQKRYLLDKLRMLYKKFVSEVGKISFSTFKKYRPFYVIPPKLKDCDTCTCLKHSNMQFQLSALKSISVLEQDDIHNVITTLVCDMKSKDCMYNDCEQRSTKEIECDDLRLTKHVTWFAWVLKEHVYGEEGNEKKTKRMMKIKKEGTGRDLVVSINADMKKFKMHVFNFYHQYKQYKFCLDNLNSNESLIHIDFSENFVCKHHEEVQAMHFGASKVQITLHTGVLYIKNEKPLSFCSISPDNKHNPEAIWAHLDPVLNYLRNTHRNINIVHFYSDGPTTQYRQKKNFYMFSKNLYDYGFDGGTWSFFEASHGKGAADGIGGAIKRNLDFQIAHGRDIPNAETAYDVLSISETNIQIFFIPADNIKSLDQSVVENLRPLSETMKIHQLITNEKFKLKYRHLSCFCNEKSGQCDCYSPLNHNFLTNERDSTIKRKRKIEQNKTEKEKNLKGRKIRKTRKQSLSSEDGFNSDDIEYAESDDTNISDISDLNVDETEKESKASHSKTISIDPNKKIVLLSCTIVKPADAANVTEKHTEVLSDVRNKLENVKSSDLRSTLQILDSRNRVIELNTNNKENNERKEKYVEELKKEETVEDEKKNESEKKCNTDNYYDSETSTAQNTTYFDVQDSVIVRYYQRKTWRYYIGFIKNIEHKEDDTYYTIHYLKTVTKPELKFITNKKLDMDIILHKNNSILKNVNLVKKGEDYYLCDDFDRVYFES